VARRAVELGGGHVDILINNAGSFPFGPTHEMTEQMFDSVYSLNVKDPYFLVAELAPVMAKRRNGAIVNVSTMVAYNVITIPAAAGLFIRWRINLPMSVGALAMNLSTIIVALNAQLLRRLKFGHDRQIYN
jgi:NAD(P)-dependent dehydrogenase (short-subunit alcohol dehydrogenase family)